MYCNHLPIRLLAMTLLLAIAAPVAYAIDLEITVTSQVPAGGFAFSPVWIGLHDGSFDAFNTGGTASAAIEAIAELGDSGPISADFTGQGPQTTIPSPGGPYTPGASGSATLSVSMPATTRFLSLGAMFVPSNDLFLGKDDPMAIALFDPSGNFLGPQTINIVSGDVWDAGTEVNDITDGAAFIAGSDATLGTTEGGTIGVFLDRPDAAAYLATILGQTTPVGYDISHVLTAGDLIATIQIQQVPEPGTLVLGAIGAAGVLACVRRKRRRPTRRPVA